MKSLIIIFLVLAGTEILSPQVFEQWVARYNGTGNNIDVAGSIAVDNLGNVYVTGATVVGGDNFDYLTIKYNSEGETQWMQTYNGSKNTSDGANSITVDNVGNVYVTGSCNFGSGNSPDYATIKYNSDGALQWERIYDGAANGSDDAYSIAVDVLGNVYVTGESANGSGDGDYATLKYNSDGALQWVRRYDNPTTHNGDGARTVKADNSGNVYVTGSSVSLTSIDFLTIKYNSVGDALWIRRYNSSGASFDSGRDLTIDNLGNVYVTGSANYLTFGSEMDYGTIKYNSNGDLQWAQFYNGPDNGADYARSIDVDKNGNVYITGDSFGSGTSQDYATIKYNSDGVLQWAQRYNGPANGFDQANVIKVDTSGNVFVTGNSVGIGSLNDYTTIKYNTGGDLEWLQRYDGPGDGNDYSNAMVLDSLGNIYITGGSEGTGSLDYATIKYSQAAVLNPRPFDKWIAAETDTIKWIENGWASVNIKCVTNFETPIESEIILTQGFPIVSPEFGWEIPDTLLSYKSKIIVENANNPNEKIESDIFRIKPYVLTRLNTDSTYYEYRKNRDQWGFSNIPKDMWPSTWYNQFDYQGIDPFTNNLQYSQSQGDSAFGKSKSHYHPDWVSWVNAFGTDACYFSANNGFYKPTALLKWWAKSNKWGGSCFGIAGTNAIAFSYKDLFLAAFPEFPDFVNPIDVTSNNGTKKIVNQIFTHQHGNPSLANDAISFNIKTPNKTINELKQMLLEDNSEARSITIYNNSGSGGHTILAYGLKQDKNFSELYYIQVYDNSNPNSNIPIIVDTTQNGGNGVWNTTDWPGWGGNLNLYLELAADTYLNPASLNKLSDVMSPFILQGEVVEINKPSQSSIKIIDDLGNFSGYFNNTFYSEIPGSIPRMIKNGSETLPYGYTLTTDNYSVVLNDFSEDTVDVFFFTGNESFSYERYGATQSQTDRLFFDGGVSAVNPDAETKTVKLLNLINETSQEKLCVVRSIELAQNDSVKIENPDSNKVKLISYGTAKSYDVEINYVTENGIGRFGDFSVPLTENTSHTFIPEWTDLTNTELQVLVDIGNDGTIDDTLYLSNQITGIGNDQGSLLTPNSFNLAQNYPNPFNPTTIIQYSIPQRSSVTLKIYDILGNEVATLINEEKDMGVYTVNFDASHLASGIYLYRIQAGSFIQTKKMILLR